VASPANRELHPAFYHSFTIRKPIGSRCSRHFALMRFSIVAHRAGETTIGLITRRWRHFEPLLLTPREALTTLAAGDAALGRLDIRQGLDNRGRPLGSLRARCRRPSRPRQRRSQPPW